jgi:hypothetical protein
MPDATLKSENYVGRQASAVQSVGLPTLPSEANTTDKSSGNGIDVVIALVD